MPRKRDNGLIVIVPDRCDFCGTCVAVCPVDCIELAEFRLTIDRDICTLCMNCVTVCPVEALAYREVALAESIVGRV
jgi:NAD-dependent dihydropyrimidine dehydrogenase PreA subunit